MTRCVDTSVIISLLTEEDTSIAAIAWLRERLPDELAATAWLWPELQAGMARKVRTQRLSQQMCQQALSRFDASIAPALAVLAVQPEDFQAAAQMCSVAATGIRAGDALHLAVASRNGLPLVTFDKQLARCAEMLGQAVELIA